jgi:RNase P subunit RPR2
MKKGKDFICDNDNPTNCPYDGARTELIEALADHCIEKCLQCGESYRFWIDDDLLNQVKS